MFKLPQGGVEDLAATAEEVALKTALWNGREGGLRRAQRGSPPLPKQSLAWGLMRVLLQRAFEELAATR
jgi:hypothetical protein